VSPRRTPVSRRDRPAKPPLSRDGVVAVALRIMRADGLEKVTMRRVAAELDTGPASLYVYVENMAELHGALLDELLAGLSVEQGRGWREDTVALLWAYTALMRDHPSLARSVLVLRPAGPNYVRLIDTLLGRLHEGGVPLRQAAWGVDVLLQAATASAAEHGAETGGEDQQQREAVREAGPDDYPNIARARDELFSGTGRERQEWTFHALIDGIARTPA
jgi:AcrR family transcriptional regulator